jgi:5-formyltetrahydrofolate cyclo-ligase
MRSRRTPTRRNGPCAQRALEDGKTLFMAVPRLAEPKAFFLLDPDGLTRSPRQATSIKGASRSGVPVDVSELQPVDLVVAGCVAVDERGARLGKGGGFSDLELAVAAEAGLVGESTVVVTTVHQLQVRSAGEIPTVGHDIHVDVVVTPERVIECARPSGYEPPRLRWDELTEEKISAIPLLQRLRATGA